MKWDTGEIMYVDQWDTKGAMVEAEGLLYCYNEKGNVGLVKPDPDGFNVISQFKITKGAGTHWAHPVITSYSIHYTKLYDRKKGLKPLKKRF